MTDAGHAGHPPRRDVGTKYSQEKGHSFGHQSRTAGSTQACCGPGHQTQMAQYALPAGFYLAGVQSFLAPPFWALGL